MKYYSFDLFLYHPNYLGPYLLNGVYLTWDPSQKEKIILFWHLLESFENPFSDFKVSEFVFKEGKVVFSFDSSSKKIDILYRCHALATLENRVYKPTLKETPRLEKFLTSKNSFIRESVKKLLQGSN